MTIRVVSLVPSITETLLQWGVTPVAVTRYCEVPGLPTVGGTKNPDVGAIVALKPDVVFMDKEENRAPDASLLTEAGLRVVATHVRGLEDVNGALAEVAEAAEVDPDLPPLPGPRPIPSPDRIRVFVPIWRRPWMTVGGSTYGSTLLSSCGLDNIYADSADPYPEIDLDDAAGRGPDRVLAPSEPYPFKEKHRAELQPVGPVWFVDGRDLFWWGWRTPGAMLRLAALTSGA